MTKCANTSKFKIDTYKKHIKNDSLIIIVERDKRVRCSRAGGGGGLYYQKKNNGGGGAEFLYDNSAIIYDAIELRYVHTPTHTRTRLKTNKHWNSRFSSVTLIYNNRSLFIVNRTRL